MLVQFCTKLPGGNHTGAHGYAVEEADHHKNHAARAKSTMAFQMEPSVREYGFRCKESPFFL